MAQTQAISREAFASTIENLGKAAAAVQKEKNKLKEEIAANMAANNGLSGPLNNASDASDSQIGFGDTSNLNLSI